MRYLEDGRLEISNNRAERSIKPFVMGRKNFLFCNTPGGAQSSAVLYSLIETAKETGLDPYRYLQWVLERAPELAQKSRRNLGREIDSCPSTGRMQSKSITLFYLSHGICRGSTAVPGLTVTL